MSLSKSQTATSVSNHLQSRHYQIALNTLAARERALNMTAFVPTPTELTGAQRDILNQLMQGADAVLQQRLVTASQVTNSFLSTIMEQLRLALQQEHSHIQTSITAVKSGVDKVHAHLMVQRHQPELYVVYGLLALIIVMILSLLFGLIWLKTSVVNQLLKGQLDNVPSWRGALHSVNLLAHSRLAEAEDGV